MPDDPGGRPVGPSTGTAPVDPQSAPATVTTSLDQELDQLVANGCMFSPTVPTSPVFARSTSDSAINTTNADLSTTSQTSAAGVGNGATKGKNALRVSYTPLSKSTYTTTARRSSQNSVYAPNQNNGPERSVRSPPPAVTSSYRVTQSRNGYAVNISIGSSNASNSASNCDARRADMPMSRPPLPKKASSDSTPIMGLPPRKPFSNGASKNGNEPTSARATYRPSASAHSRSPSRVSMNDGAQSRESALQPGQSRQSSSGIKRPGSPTEADTKRARAQERWPPALTTDNYPDVGRVNIKDKVVDLPKIGSYHGVPYVRNDNGKFVCLAPACNEQDFPFSKAFVQHAEGRKHHFKLARPPRATQPRAADQHSQPPPSQSSPKASLATGASRQPLPFKSTLPPGAMPSPSKMSAASGRVQACSAPISTPSPQVPADLGRKSELAQSRSAAVPPPAPKAVPATQEKESMPRASKASPGQFKMANASSNAATSSLSANQTECLEKLWEAHLGFAGMRDSMPDVSIWQEISKLPSVAIRQFLISKTGEKAVVEIPVVQASNTNRNASERSRKDMIRETSTQAAQAKAGTSGSENSRPSTQDSRPSSSFKTEKAGQARVKPIVTAKPLKRPRWEYILVDPDAEKQNENEIEFTIGKTRRQERVLRNGSVDEEPTPAKRPKRTSRNLAKKSSGGRADVSSDDVPLSLLTGDKSAERNGHTALRPLSETESSDKSDAPIVKSEPKPKSKPGPKPKSKTSQPPLVASRTFISDTDSDVDGAQRAAMAGARGKPGGVGPVSGLMARLESHTVLGKPINVDDWVRAQLGSHKQIFEFLAKVAAVLPPSASMQSVKYKPASRPQEPMSESDVEDPPAGGPSKQMSGGHFTTLKVERGLPPQKKPDPVYAQQTAVKAPQRVSDTVQSPARAPVSTEGELPQAPETSEAPNRINKQCVFCGILAEPSILSKHVDQHLSHKHVPSIELMKVAESISGGTDLVVSYSEGKAPQFKPQQRLVDSRAVHPRLPIHYGDLTNTQHVWLQTRTCHMTEIPLQQFCVDCRNDKTSCRFRNVRKFVDPPSTDPSLLLRYVLTSTHASPENSSIVSSGNHLPRDDAAYLLRRLACALEDTLEEREDEHEEQERILHCPAETTSSARCDACSSPFFLAHVTCYICGTFLCLNCYNAWDDSAESETGKNFDCCVPHKGREMRHSKKHMIPFTCFKLQEVSDFWQQLKEFPPYTAASVGVGRVFKATQHEEWSLSICHEEIDKLTPAMFQRHWSTGEPLLLQGVSIESSRPWEPGSLSSSLASEEVELANAANVLRRTSIKNLFGSQDQAPSRALGIELDKLRSSAAKPLVAAIERMLPCQEYTARHGSFNLVSWLPGPLAAVMPGPTLHMSNFVAGATLTGDALQIRMSDTVNISLWAGDGQDVEHGRKGCVVWDIFPQRNVGILRRYMLKYCNKAEAGTQEDAIRRASRYLTEDDLVDLRFQYRVSPVRVYQNPGEAVLIPAGCPFQVASLAANTSVSCQFVSPENLNRYWTILRNDTRSDDLVRKSEIYWMQQYVYNAWRGVTGQFPKTAAPETPVEDWQLSNEEGLAQMEDAQVEGDQHGQMTSAAADTDMTDYHGDEETTEDEQDDEVDGVDDKAADNVGDGNPDPMQQQVGGEAIDLTNVPFSRPTSRGSDPGVSTQEAVSTQGIASAQQKQGSTRDLATKAPISGSRTQQVAQAPRAQSQKLVVIYPSQARPASAPAASTPTVGNGVAEQAKGNVQEPAVSAPEQQKQQKQQERAPVMSQSGTTAKIGEQNGSVQKSLDRLIDELDYN